MDKQTMANRGRKTSSSTKGSNKGKAPSYRVYCPECIPPSADPERGVHVNVSAGTKRVTAACGHTFPVGSASQ